MKNKIVFFGTGPVAADSLRALIDEFDIELVITKAAPVHHRGTKPVETLANERSLLVQFANNGAELSQIIDNSKLESRVGVIVDYGVLLPKKVLDFFELGIINSHFSLLPEWRGADPISFTILSGQKKTGVSLMIVEPELDTGQLIAQQELVIDTDDTTPTLTTKLVELSNRMLKEYLPLFIDGKIEPKGQLHHENATYSRRLAKADGELDPATMTAMECERRVRAFIGFPKTKLKLAGLDCTVIKAEVSDMKSTSLDQLCKDGRYLVIRRLVPAGGKEMSAQDFLNGHVNKH